MLNDETIKSIITEVYGKVLLRNPNNTLECTNINSCQTKDELYKWLYKDLVSSAEYIELCGLKRFNTHIKTYNKISKSGCGCKEKKLKHYWNELWKMLHTITFIYPDNPTLLSKQRIVLFFDNLGENILCPECKEHYNNYVIDNPISKVTNRKESYIIWLIDLHNNINLRNVKETLSVEKVYSIYENDKEHLPRICRLYNIDQKKFYGL